MNLDDHFEPDQSKIIKLFHDPAKINYIAYCPGQCSIREEPHTYITVAPNRSQSTWMCYKKEEAIK